MRALALCLGTGILLTAACGGSSGSKSTNANGRDPKTGFCVVSASGQACAGVAAFDACVTSTCDAQAKAALGNSYASGSFSGPCSDYMNCMLACPCDATASTCETNCLALVATNASCTTPGLALETCITSSCTVPVCSGGTGTGATTSTGAATSTSVDTATDTSVDTATLTSVNTATLTNLSTGTGGANCTKLQTCCDALVASGLTTGLSCAAVSSLADASCASLLATYAPAGLCQ